MTRRATPWEIRGMSRFEWRAYMECRALANLAEPPPKPTWAWQGAISKAYLEYAEDRDRDRLIGETMAIADKLAEQDLCWACEGTYHPLSECPEVPEHLQAEYRIIEEREHAKRTGEGERRGTAGPDA